MKNSAAPYSDSAPRLRRDPWTVREVEFPHLADPSAQLRFALNYAVRAPSVFNVQPWLFRINGSEIELYADRTRALRLIDPEDRELVISCGAALYYLRVALNYFGMDARVQMLPSWEDSDLLARIVVQPGTKADRETRKLFTAIDRVRPHLAPFKNVPVPVRLLARLKMAAWKESARLHVVRGGKVHSILSTLVGAAERIQESDPGFRQEMSTWIPGNSLGENSSFAEVRHLLKDPFVLRTFDGGDGHAAHGRFIAEGSPVMLVVGSDSDNTLAWLSAGQALGRVLLQLHSDGLRSSFLNQPLEVPRLRNEVIRVTKLSYPQFIIRAGYSENNDDTSLCDSFPRRPVEDVLTTPYRRWMR